jgi:hypothetical protein
MKNLPWFNTKGQVAQLVAAVFGCAIAASVAWPKIKDNELLSPGPILFFILVFIVILSVGLLLYSRYAFSHLQGTPREGPEAPKVPEVTVVSPQGRAKTRAEDGKRYFEVEGTLKQLPPGTEIWAFVKDVSEPKWWPHGPAVVNGTYWTIGNVNPGTSKNVKLQVCLVGKSGQALIAYFRLVGGVMRQLKGDVTKRNKSIDTDEFKAPAITDLGSDMIFIFDKLLPVE